MNILRLTKNVLRFLVVSSNKNVQKKLTLIKKMIIFIKITLLYDQAKVNISLLNCQDLFATKLK